MFSTIKKWFQPSEPEKVLEKTDHITAAMVLMLEVAWSDRNIEIAEEQTILMAIQTSFDLTEEEAKNRLVDAKALHRESVGSYEFTTLINNQLSYEEKTQIIQTLWKISNSDQHIDQWEEHAIRKIAGLLYIDHQDFIDTKIKTKQEED
jgi:uncharacterized tellurite resistance protein B-like protein